MLLILCSKYRFSKAQSRFNKMFRNTFYAGFLSILYAVGSAPLEQWASHVEAGYIKRITDYDIVSSVIEIMGTNIATNYITTPADPNYTLAIKLPYLVMLIKNMKKYFSFEIQILDDKNIKRRFRASNYQRTTRVKPFICTMPLCLGPGFNQIYFNLIDFTARAYRTNYIETSRMTVHANCRLRRIYFADSLYEEDEIPADFRMYVDKKGAKKQE